MRKVLLWLSGVAVGFAGGIYCLLRGRYTQMGLVQDILCHIEKSVYGSASTYRFEPVNRVPRYTNYANYARKREQ